MRIKWQIGKRDGDQQVLEGDLGSRVVYFRPQANPLQMAWCLNVLVWKMPLDAATWLKEIGVGEVNKACHADLIWDAEMAEFRLGTPQELT